MSAGKSVFELNRREIEFLLRCIPAAPFTGPVAAAIEIARTAEPLMQVLGAALEAMASSSPATGGVVNSANLGRAAGDGCVVPLPGGREVPVDLRDVKVEMKNPTAAAVEKVCEGFGRAALAAASKRGAQKKKRSKKPAPSRARRKQKRK